MKDTRFIRVSLSDPQRVLAINPAHISSIDLRPGYSATVHLTGGESHLGTFEEMRPVLAAAGLLDELEAEEASEASEAPEAEPELSAEELREVRALLVAIHADEDTALVLAQEMIAEQLDNERLLDLDWNYGYVEPGRAPLLVLLERETAAKKNAPKRPNYRERSADERAAWIAANGLLWQAIKKAGLSPEPALRHAAASKLLGIDVHSYQELYPGQLDTIRYAVETGWFYSNWSIIVPAERTAQPATRPATRLAA